MEDIAEGARRVLNYIENNGSEDRYITGYIRAVRQFALNAQHGDGQGMAKVLKALTKINADTERLNQRIDTIEKTTSILSTNVSTSAANSAAAWRDFRARDWQRGLAKAAAPNTRSNGTSSPGVPEIELREDREVIVKVGPNREQIRGLTPRELVERAERLGIIFSDPHMLAMLPQAVWFTPGLFIVKLNAESYLGRKITRLENQLDQLEFCLKTSCLKTTSL